MNIRVAIIEDDAPTRELLSALVAGAPDMECVLATASVETALPGLDARAPDVILLDVQLPGMSGAAGAALLRARRPATEIVILTSFSDRDRVFEAICNGACGYLLKSAPPERLLDAIREAKEGGAPMSPGSARMVVELFRRTAPQAASGSDLTAQELRVLRHLADGADYRTAAERLGISVNTVRNYIRNVYEKLHVHSKSEAVSKALRMGLIE